MGGPADEGDVGRSEESLEFVLGYQGQSRAHREGLLGGLQTSLARCATLCVCVLSICSLL